jgi:hypothetical protein
MRSGIGRRREGYNRSKGEIPRHGDSCKRTLNAVEKTEKTRVRREGKRECLERD